LFLAATTDPDNAKLIARVIIRRVFGWNLTDIEVGAEKQYPGVNVGQKGIRLDLEVIEKEDGKVVRIYDIEPNAYVDNTLPKRSRYYQALSDVKHLKSSTIYSVLPDYFSIWILPYDPFGDNRMIYTVKNTVVENPELEYNDGVTRVFLYTDGNIGGTEEIRALLKYFMESNDANAVDSELEAIQHVVSGIKKDREVGERYMTLDDVINYEKRDSYNEGRKAGVTEGADKFISACRKMNHSDDDIINQLIEEFSLTKKEAIAKLTNN
jgi:predicted transposase/invertase (TIGR01784 family)